MSSEGRIILRRETQSSKSVNGGGESIPIDLIIDILSRLPTKSIARFRCISKLWASILRRPDFTELFFIRSSSRPQVLFAFQKLHEVYLFSIPQPRIHHDELVSPVVATYVTKIPFRAEYERFSISNGLFFLRENFIPYTASTNRELSTRVVFNPSTRQFLQIPNLNLKRRNIFNFFMGYDPIEKQYKLLSISKPFYQVLTLGSGTLLWRDILCSTEHSSRGDGVCIDGVLYYLAVVKNAAVGDIMIVSFDINSEKFTFMKTMENYIEECRIATLINYNGKLGSVKADDTCFVDGGSEILKMFVLEDPKKQKWSQHFHVLPPPLWKDVVGEDGLSIVGAVDTDEIVLSSINYTSSFYLVYYNTKKKSVIKVEIQRMEASEDNEVYTFLNHVENLMPLS